MRKMSPASQGPLEVERYTGSCLISSNARSTIGGKTSIAGITNKQQEGGLARGNQQRDYAQQGNYLSGNEQCQYGTWAGAPLISMTSSLRRSHQQSSPPPYQNHQQSVQQQQGQQVQTHMQNQSPLSRLAIHTQGAPLILAGRFHNRAKVQSCNGMNGSSVNNSGNSISNANINGNITVYCNGNSVSVGSGIGNSNINSAGKYVSSRGQRLAEPARKPQQQQQQGQSQQQVHPKSECINGKVDGANIANIDSLSIASDESSGSNNSENSLPRIIKPRKRRKKDRKPTGVTITEVTAKADEHQQHHQQQQQQQQHQQQSPPQQQHPSHQQTQQNNQLQHHPNGIGISEQSNIVTLKPYVPICYENRYEQNRAHRRPQPITKQSYIRTQNQNISCNGPMQLNHQQQEIIDTRQQHHQNHHHHHHQQQQQQPQHQQLQQQQQQPRYMQRHVQVQVLDDNKNVIIPALPPSMLSRSMTLPSKGNNLSTNNYPHRNHYHMAYHRQHHHQHNEARNGNSNSNCSTVVGNASGIMNTIPRHRYPQNHISHTQHQQASQHEYEPMLMGCDDNIVRNDSPSSSLNSAGCQCRYCDPSGLIWDVDQNVYSPFLTPPHTSEFPVTTDYGVSQQHQYNHLPQFLSRTGSAIAGQEQPSSNGCEYFELPDSPTIAAQWGHNRNNRHQVSQCIETGGATKCGNSSTGNSCNAQLAVVTSAVTMLRRSWSDPTSYFSEEVTAPSRDVGVIGDRGQTELPRGRSSWPGSSAPGLSAGSAGNSPYGNHVNLPISSPGLEVSTEIVTSPNGHRDLEIKFYSSSPSALPIEDDKSTFIDDGEDFSDIWTYHENKLQQDFSTLLQAEE